MAFARTFFVFPALFMVCASLFSLKANASESKLAFGIVLQEHLGISVNFPFLYQDSYIQASLAGLYSHRAILDVDWQHHCCSGALPEATASNNWRFTPYFGLGLRSVAGRSTGSRQDYGLRVPVGLHAAAFRWPISFFADLAYLLGPAAEHTRPYSARIGMHIKM